MKKTTLLLLLLLLPLASAQNEWFITPQTISMHLFYGSNISIAQKPGSDIKYVRLNNTFFPQSSYRQTHSSITTWPDSAADNESLLFEWTGLESGRNLELYYRIDADINTVNQIAKVTSKVVFPFSIPSDIKKYAEPSDHIDINPGIREVAASLAQGEDDAYVIMALIAEWVDDNIEYNLSTLTADVNQNSSWVLANRYGVCDEITGLYISLLRSVGIPARFISGVSYSDSELFTEKWGPHAWAEVWLPEYGWIPVDVVYKQIGFVDPAHIALKKSVDSDEPAIRYEWKASDGVEVSSDKIQFNVSSVSTQGSVDPRITLEVLPYRGSVGFGSYNLLEVRVKNRNDYYYVAPIYHSITDSLNITPEMEYAILPPLGEAKLYFTVQTDRELDEMYEYTFKVSVYSIFNEKATGSFIAESEGPQYSKSDISEITEANAKTKSYMDKLDVRCNNKPEYFIFEDAVVECIFTNLGNTNIIGTVCNEAQECLPLSLFIGQESALNFSINKSDTKLKFLTNFNDNTRIDIIRYDVSERPEVLIAGISYPMDVKYGEQFNITFSTRSQTSLKGKSLTVYVNKREYELNAEGLENGKYTLKLDTTELLKENKVKIVATYSAGDREFSSEEPFIINMETTTIWQRIKTYFNRFR